MVGVAVHIVIVPCGHIGAVHAGDEHTVSGKEGVPTGLLTVLDGEELVFGRSQ